MGLYNLSIAPFCAIELIILLLWVNYKNKKIVFVFCIILLSFMYSRILLIKYDNAFLSNEEVYIAKVISIKEKVKYYNRYIVKIKSKQYYGYRVLIYTKDELNYGSIISFSEIIEKPEKIRNEKRF